MRARNGDRERRGRQQRGEDQEQIGRKVREDHGAMSPMRAASRGDTSCEKAERSAARRRWCPPSANGRSKRRNSQSTSSDDREAAAEGVEREQRGEAQHDRARAPQRRRAVPSACDRRGRVGRVEDADQHRHGAVEREAGAEGVDERPSGMRRRQLRQPARQRAERAEQRAAEVVAREQSRSGGKPTTPASAPPARSAGTR